MTCCCPHSVSAGRIFSSLAGRYGKRFQRKGLEPSQTQLVEGLSHYGFKNATLLEIGCGVGFLHQYLLQQGAESAVGIDLAQRMLEVAREVAVEKGLNSRVSYLQGDVVDIADRFQPADISLLDKVICCYPDAESLLSTTLQKTGKAIALTYPRDRWITRFGVKLGALLLWLIRSDFRPYVHSPEDIADIIQQSGLKKIYRNQTWIWLTEIYAKP